MKKLFLTLVIILSGIAFTANAQSVDVYKSKFTGSGYKNEHVGRVELTLTEDEYNYTVEIYNDTSESVRVTANFIKPTGSLSQKNIYVNDLMPQETKTITVSRGLNKDGRVEGITNIKAVAK